MCSTFALFIYDCSDLNSSNILVIFLISRLFLQPVQGNRTHLSIQLFVCLGPRVPKFFTALEITLINSLGLNSLISFPLERSHARQAMTPNKKTRL